MMGGYGMGMGGGMMGMGMTGGGGMGMMGGGGMGMMGGDGLGMFGMLDLTDEQRTKISKIHDDLRKQHWAMMGKMMDEQNALRDLYQADVLDAKKIGAVYGNLGKLRQQMAETHVEAKNKIHALLTPEQRDQMRQWRRGGCGPMGMRPPGAPARGMMGR
jgi:Spy/CpxP family protein refolding chaperone